MWHFPFVRSTNKFTHNTKFTRFHTFQQDPDTLKIMSFWIRGRIRLIIEIPGWPMRSCHVFTQNTSSSPSDKQIKETMYRPEKYVRIFITRTTITIQNLKILDCLPQLYEDENHCDECLRNSIIFL